MLGKFLKQIQYNIMKIDYLISYYLMKDLIHFIQLIFLRIIN